MSGMFDRDHNHVLVNVWPKTEAKPDFADWTKQDSHRPYVSVEFGGVCYFLGDPAQALAVSEAFHNAAEALSRALAEAEATPEQTRWAERLSPEAPF